MDKKTLTFLFLLIVLVVNNVYALSYYARGSNLTIVCLANSNLMFQNTLTENVSLNIASGVLNCSDGSLRIHDAGGSFRFTALNDTTITITYSMDQLKVQGDQDREFRVFQSGNTITVLTGNNVLISWSYTIEPLFPLMFILGMCGLVAIIGGSLYAVDNVKKGEYYKGLANGTIYVAFGIALFLAWLWAGVTV